MTQLPTLTLDPSQLKLATNIQDVASAMGNVGGDAGKLWTDLVLAAHDKFGNGWQDAVTVNDLVVLAAQLVADVGGFVPNPVSAVAAQVLTVDRLVTSALPQALAVYQFLSAVAALAPQLKIAPATPDEIPNAGVNSRGRAGEPGAS